MLIGYLLDLADGAVARQLNACSALGKWTVPLRLATKLYQKSTWSRDKFPTSTFLVTICLKFVHPPQICLLNPSYKTSHYLLLGNTLCAWSYFVTQNNPKQIPTLCICDHVCMDAWNSSLLPSQCSPFFACFVISAWLLCGTLLWGVVLPSSNFPFCQWNNHLHIRQPNSTGFASNCLIYPGALGSQHI